ncbi:cytochrome c oxidase assembly protein COX18, mitochondrial-like [Neodiprion virginianus]|uniref:cytochrome c oxidase assembly protein COX18, mitochondrial-like n=1 Tax=Neodiprion virginianus TaxID=2961670 RepID=UPI001EE772B2|nr:cytochrome c oxidase assembly protein COX18, mitochondrial-like [Neodiprion virginianus]
MLRSINYNFYFQRSLNFTHAASMCSVNVRLVSYLRRSTHNPNLNQGASHIDSGNSLTYLIHMSKTMSPVAGKDSLFNFDRNTPSQFNTQSATGLRSSHTGINISRNCSKPLINSMLLLANRTRYTVLHPKHFRVRQFSSETTQYVPQVRLTGVWKDISESTPVEFVQDTLVTFQSTTGLPWWATIVLTTVIVRSTLTLPLSLYQHYIIAKVQNLNIEMSDIVKKLQAEANVAVSHYKCPEDHARMLYNTKVKEKWDELIQRENCHPGKGYIVLWTQIPLWITISAALRNLCFMLPPGRTDAEKNFLDLTTGGFGWVTNLVAIDQFCIVPISVGLFNLANIEIMNLLKTTEDTRLQKCLLYFLRFISIAMIPISMYVPSCMCLYWASSSAFGIVQNLLLQSPKVRRLAGIPLTKTARTNPYREMYTKLKTKWYFNFMRKSNSRI